MSGPNPSSTERISGKKDDMIAAALTTIQLNDHQQAKPHRNPGGTHNALTETNGHHTAIRLRRSDKVGTAAT